MLIPDPRRTPLPNLISHNGVILYQWEFLRAHLDEGEGLPWIAMDLTTYNLVLALTLHSAVPSSQRSFLAPQRIYTRELQWPKLIAHEMLQINNHIRKRWSFRRVCGPAP